MLALTALCLGNVTLIIELFDVLVKVIDPKKDQMDLSDDFIKCFHVQTRPPQIVSVGERVVYGGIHFELFLLSNIGLHAL